MLQRHRILVLTFQLVLMFSLFGCTRKKDTTKEVQQWLDKNFAGQFEILKTEYATNQWISLDKTSFKIALGAIADPEVQFVIPWNRSAKDGGMTREALESAYQNAVNETAAGRSLLRLLQQSGLSNIAVGYSSPYADIMLFTEPTPEVQVQVLKAVQEALKAWSPAAEADVQLLLMEEKSQGERFQDLIPRKMVHALERDLWQQDNCLYHLQWDSKASIQELKNQWTINCRAVRTSAYRDSAYQCALAWVTKAQLKPPIRLEANQLIGEQVDDNDLKAIRYWFPYFLDTLASGEEAAPDGHIVVVYQTEKQSCVLVKQERNPD